MRLDPERPLPQHAAVGRLQAQHDQQRLVLQRAGDIQPIVPHRGRTEPDARQLGLPAIVRVGPGGGNRGGLADAAAVGTTETGPLRLGRDGRYSPDQNRKRDGDRQAGQFHRQCSNAGWFRFTASVPPSISRETMGHYRRDLFSPQAAHDAAQRKDPVRAVGQAFALRVLRAAPRSWVVTHGGSGQLRDDE